MIIDDNKKKNLSEVVDLTKFNEDLGATINFDPEVNPLDRQPPLPPGTYAMKVTLAAQDPVVLKTLEDGTKYFVLNLVLKVVQGEFTNRSVYHKVSTRLLAGLNTTTMGHFLYKCGASKDSLAKLTKPLDLVKAAVKYLNTKEPVLQTVTVDWQAYSTADNRTVANRYSAFPPNRDGHVSHIYVHVTSNGAKEELTARPYVVSLDNPAVAKSATGAAKPAAVVVVPSTPAAPAPAAAPAAVVTPATAMMSADDGLEDLMNL